MEKSNNKQKPNNKNKKQKLLDELKQDILNNLNCPLKKEAKNLVFGKGNPDAKILFIGEAPGAKEDELGIPFVGRAGKDLDKALNKINLTLDDIYIANILKYRPPKNRDPKKEEIINHTPYLIKQIQIIKPKIIATLGNFSTKFVLSNFNPENMKKIEGISEINGKKFKVKLENDEFLIIPIYHPSAMIYKPSLREDFEKDFQIFAKIIGIKIDKKKEETQKKLI